MQVQPNDGPQLVCESLNKGLAAEGRDRRSGCQAADGDTRKTDGIGKIYGILQGGSCNLNLQGIISFGGKKIRELLQALHIVFLEVPVKWAPTIDLTLTWVQIHPN
jgi:hypothetical protein